MSGESKKIEKKEKPRVSEVFVRSSQVETVRAKAKMQAKADTKKEH